MAECPQHTFLALTKRAERMAYVLADRARIAPNIWLGATVCTQEEANEKIPWLLKVPANHRFISVEPMLERVDIGEWLLPPERTGVSHGGLSEYIAGPSLLDWVVCGPETGPGRRPFHKDWSARLYADCTEAGVPFFYKGQDQPGAPRQLPWENKEILR